MYDIGWRTEAFYVQGEMNISDFISRNFGGLGCGVSIVRPYEGIFPCLGEYAHPFASGSRERPEHMV